ncbi:unnamed protein product [Paramecium primaurelia]|uniref:Transmembrane protein n=1 Tax=Paramecium primaurelia TaxID=5886 RepID=A0A8S1KI02_PARPR|nr:unnamed protein product [Paramecium primaurelia]
MNDFKKEKFQIIESYQNNPKKNFRQTKIILNNGNEQTYRILVQNHSSILKLYQQTINFYIEDINQKKIVALDQNKQLYIKDGFRFTSINIKIFIKQQFLEQQAKQLIQRPSLKNQFSFKSIIILILIIALNQIMIFFQYCNGKNELQQYMDNFQFIVNELQSKIEEKRDSMFYEFKIELFQQMNEMNDQIDILNQKLDQTETPFNQFKNILIVNQWEQYLIQFLKLLYQINLRIINNLILIDGKIFTDNNRTSSILQLQQLRVIKSEEDLKIFKKNSNLNIESVQRQKTQLMNNIMKISLKNINQRLIKNQ